ncbi:uncharacterized protein [Bemisia tabaci]|uniref:uncharacterized protein n=1 Tax=Bemisia tabaci TaxID=7038 RepID=UPI003B2802BC
MRHRHPNALGPDSEAGGGGRPIAIGGQSNPDPNSEPTDLRRETASPDVVFQHQNSRRGPSVAHSSECTQVLPPMKRSIAAASKKRSRGGQEKNPGRDWPKGCGFDLSYAT